MPNLALEMEGRAFPHALAPLGGVTDPEFLRSFPLENVVRHKGARQVLNSIKLPKFHQMLYQATIRRHSG